MPRASRVKAKAHATAAQLPSKRTFTVPSSQVQESILPGSHSAQADDPTLQPAASSSRHRQKRLNIPTSAVPPPLPAHPYSRSHLRREKRKTRQELSGGSLATIAHALPEAVEQSRDERGQALAERGAGDNGVAASKNIGEGGKGGLSEKAKRKQIVIETKRLPAVMRHPVFKGDPWATIREHARNTLDVKQVPGSKRR